METRASRQTKETPPEDKEAETQQEDVGNGEGDISHGEETYTIEGSHKQFEDRFVHTLNANLNETMQNVLYLAEESRRRDSEMLSKCLQETMLRMQNSMDEVSAKVTTGLQGSEDLNGKQQKEMEVMHNIRDMNNRTTTSFASKTITSTQLSSASLQSEGRSDHPHRMHKGPFRDASNYALPPLRHEREHVSRDIPQSMNGHFSKLPVFNGTESWKVWFNRFQDVATIQGWSEQTMLLELLPKLQGVAGNFVYEQLPRATRSNFTLLTQELGFRFRKVETTRTYAAKFNNRCQRPNETAEEYAAELKALYDKAYPNREGRTRNEDLLRRFMDGLLDDRVQV